MTADGRHHELLDVMLRGSTASSPTTGPACGRASATSRPWWLPEAAEDRIFERLLDGARNVLPEVARNPDHELRRDFDARVRRLVDGPPDARRRCGPGARSSSRSCSPSPSCGPGSAGVWTDVKAGLRAQAADPDSELRRRLADTLVALGPAARRRPGAGRRVEERSETGVRYVAEQFRDEIAAMVSGTIARWDAERDRRPPGAAARPRPPVHPHQRHRGRRPRRPAIHAVGPGP